MRKWNARLELEPLERRDNPSAWGDFWDGVAYYGGAAWDGLKEGATNIATGARDAVVELGRTGGDLVTIYSNWDNIDPSQLNSKLFQGAAATAGNPQAAAQFDNQLVFGIATLGVGPLVQSGVKATETGDWSEFSHQAGGFGVMVLVPYAGVKGLNALPPMPVRVPVFQPSAALVTADGMLVAVPGGVAWETVAVVSFAVPVEAATALGGTGAVFAVAANGPGGGGTEPNGGSGEPAAQGDAVPNAAQNEVAAQIALRQRMQELGYNLEQKAMDLREGLGGARYESVVGRKIARSTTDGADLVDPAVGPISLKGPLGVRTVETAPGLYTTRPIQITQQMVDGLAESVIKDFTRNTMTKRIVVDLKGLTAEQRAAVVSRIQEGIRDAKPATPKDIFIVE